METRGKWKCTNIGQDKILEDTNKTREKFPLRYLQTNEAMFMLGMYLALYGNNKDKVKYMNKNSNVWETSIRAGGVQHNKSWKFLNLTIPQTMKKTLSAMTLNEE